MGSTFLGVAVAVAAFFSLVVASLLDRFPVLLDYRWCGVGFLGLLSGIFAVAWVRSAQGLRAGTTSSDRVALLRGWCLIMAVLGAISIFLQPLRPFSKTKPKPVAVAAAPQPLPKILPPPPAPTAPCPPVKFPKLKIQGILFQPNKRLVIIEGDSYAPGDRVYDLRIKSIERNTVTVEKDGVEKIIHFD